MVQTAGVRLAYVMGRVFDPPCASVVKVWFNIKGIEVSSVLRVNGACPERTVTVTVFDAFGPNHAPSAALLATTLQFPKAFAVTRPVSASTAQMFVVVVE